MKISRKMILIFFIMICIIVGINAYYLTTTNLAGADAFTADRYKNMAQNMVRNIDQYVSSMDLAIETLTSNNEFMENFYHIANNGDEDISATLSAQNSMTQTLYHSPVIDNFYRVSVFARNGFYLSNHIDRNDSVISFSEEAIDIINSISHLNEVDSTPYRRHIIGPHNDYFTIARKTNVFSICKSVSLHGKQIGYIEVSSSINELSDIFMTDNPAVSVTVKFKDGSYFYRSSDDPAEYSEISMNELTDYTDPSGLKRQVYHTQSQLLGLDIYIAQDAAYSLKAASDLTFLYLRYSAVVAAVALVMVVIVSMGLTRSIRKLIDKLRGLPIEKVLEKKPSPEMDTHVALKSDREIYELEDTFNMLMHRVHASAQREMELREGTLNARLKALQAQINPHFVYNMLNIISSKAMDAGNEDIVEMSDQFAQMLRYANDTRTDYVTLSDDLANVGYYLTLLKARYEDGLEFTINVPENMNAIMVPRLSLQPLVENSIVHGFDGEIDIRRISINGYINAREAILEIRDNGSGFAPEKLNEIQEAIRKIQTTYEAPAANGHIGLLNTCWRLSVYSKGALSMEIQNDNGAVVRLKTKINDRDS
ncbi:MAG: histidine kinase [Parasporobacterium sp.]|nr:histidine kinase [Parasporobacterium sp.]